MLVRAAKISLFHVFRKTRCAISRMVNTISAIMAKIIPIIRCSFGGTITCLTFLRLLSQGTVIFLANSFLSRFLKVYPAVFFSQALHEGSDTFFEDFYVV